MPNVISTITAFALLNLVPIASSAAAADDCGTVRLDSPNKAFAKIPVYNQTKNDNWDTNLCYAIVAAQLRDAARFNQGDPLDKLSAPVSIALNNKAYLKQSGIDHRNYGTLEENDAMIGPGSPRAAVVLSNDRAVCDQTFLGAHIPLVDGVASRTDTNVSGFLMEIYQGMEARRVSAAERAESEKFAALFPQLTNCRKSAVSNMESIFRVVDQAIEPSRRFVLQGHQFINKLCEDHSFTSSVAPPKLVPIKSQKQMQNELNTQLAKNVPVGIAYCHEYLQFKAPCPAAHTSVIIGRARRGGQCHYLMRDSYGAKCTARFTCEPDGSIWVPAAELSATASMVFYIPPGKTRP